MKTLSPKQEKYCLLRFEGKEQVEAYREAYNNFSAQKQSVEVAASRLEKKDFIQFRLKELRHSLQEKSLWTKEKAVEVLLEVINHPDKTSDIISAVKELNSMHGFDKPKPKAQEQTLFFDNPQQTQDITEYLQSMSQ